MDPNIKTRVFLVGCPRSGTTLLQSLLAANSRTQSFPETHFYEKLFGGRQLLLALGISSRKARLLWKVFLEEVGHPEMNSILPKYAFLVRQFSNAFVEVLDKLTMKHGKPVWVEKTPGHLRRIDQIEKFVDNARFVHILRNGEDNIASLFEVGKKYPEFWGSGYSTLEKCMNRWITDTRISMRYSSQKNHYLVMYEQLIRDPRQALVALCNFIGVPYEEEMLLDYPTVIGQIVLKTETWKTSVSRPISFASKRKFNDFLNEEQRQYIHANLPEDVAGYLNFKEREVRMMCGF